MRILNIVAWIIFALGLLLKLMHLPVSSLSMVIGVLLLLLHSTIYLFKNAKTDLANSFTYLTFTSWTIYLLFRVQFWPCGFYILGFNVAFLIPLTVS
jgi:uncharacterized membrane protein